MELLEPVVAKFDQIKKVTANGGEYWMARDLQAPLGYAKWSDFEGVIEKARMACESTGVDPSDHFAPASKMVNIGSDAGRQIVDFFLTRYAAYLIAMNGSPRLPQIAAAQTYFAVQTRKQEKKELSDKFGGDISKRMELRDRVKDANKHLGEAAQAAGVQHYDLFHAAGYRGLYGMGLNEVKQKKGVDQKEELLDRVGRAELAANEFRITQTEGVLRNANIKGDLNARNTHEKVGKAVRETIEKLGGTKPENLPAEPSLKQIEREAKKRPRIQGGSSGKENKKDSE